MDCPEGGNVERKEFVTTEEQRIEEFRQITKGIFTDKQIEKLISMGYFKAPASLSHHGTMEGDLYHHSKMIYMQLEEYTQKLYLSWKDGRSPIVIGFLHDLCKADDYIWEDGKYVRNKDCAMTGHGEKSAIMALQLFPELTDEEVMCIRYHMGAYEGQEKWKTLGNAIKSYPNILWVHHADMITSQIWKV